MKINRFIALSVVLSLALAATPEEWKTRSIYQLLTDRFSRGNGDKSGCADLGQYCGGTFKGITQNLDYIQDLGFNAIWISPVPLNYEGAYHGYAAKDLTKINPHFGTDEELKTLVEQAHKRDIWVMVDVVANHMCPVNGDDFSQIVPFNKAEYYHPRCDIDFSNQQSIQNCWLATLSDLNQSVEFVKDQLTQWITNLIRDYGFDGCRVDTERHVPKDFWRPWNDAAGVFMTGEVFDGNLDYVGSYQGPLDSILHYPLYFTLKDVFMGKQSMWKIHDLDQGGRSAFKDQSVLANFLSNHDNPRWLNMYGDWTTFKSALTFLYFYNGIPIVYYGDEQGFAGGADPRCRETLWTNMQEDGELFKYIQQLNQIRKDYKVWNSEFQEYWVEDNMYVIRRGNLLIAVTHEQPGSTVSYDITNHPFKAGETVCDLLYDKECVTVSSDNKLHLVLKDGHARIYTSASNELIE